MAGGSKYKAVATSHLHTCAVRMQSSEVQCWGVNGYGQLGDQTSSNATSPKNTKIAGSGALLLASSVAVGEEFSCAATGDTALYCWGRNSDGQLGVANTVALAGARQVPGTWLGVTTGDTHACAIDTSNHLYCWGRNDNGQLGDGSFVSRSVPTIVRPDMTWSAVKARGSHTCATTMAGDMAKKREDEVMEG